MPGAASSEGPAAVRRACRCSCRQEGLGCLRVRLNLHLPPRPNPAERRPCPLPCAPRMPAGSRRPARRRAHHLLLQLRAQGCCHAGRQRPAAALWPRAAGPPADAPAAAHSGEGRGALSSAAGRVPRCVRRSAGGLVQLPTASPGSPLLLLLHRVPAWSTGCAGAGAAVCADGGGGGGDDGPGGSAPPAAPGHPAAGRGVAGERPGWAAARAMLLLHGRRRCTQACCRPAPPRRCAGAAHSLARPDCLISLKTC